MLKCLAVRGQFCSLQTITIIGRLHALSLLFVISY